MDKCHNGGMKMRTDRYRCERCKHWLSIGDRAVRKYGRLWHVDCAVAYSRQRARRLVG